MFQEETDYPTDSEISEEDDEQELISLTDNDNIQGNELVLDEEDQIATQDQKQTFLIPSGERNFLICLFTQILMNMLDLETSLP